MATRTRVSGLMGWAAGLMVVALGAKPVPAISGEGPPVMTPEQCASVRAGPQFNFQGHTLLEIPDIEEPELRRANALLSERCIDQAVQLITDFAAAHPENYHVFFVRSRVLWVMGEKMRAHSTIEAASRIHPDFTSAKILLASMFIEDHNYPEAEKLLDEVEKVHPEDLWLYMDRLRIEANLIPTPSTVQTIAAVIADERFPSSARMQAYRTSKYELSGLSEAEHDKIFEQAMSSGSLNQDCTLADQALELIELRGDAKAGARLIEKHLRTSGRCVATPVVRALLAEAYLLEAAGIAPLPVAANAKLTREAKEALGGDLTTVADRVAINPSLAPIIPFLKGSMNPRHQNENGRTLICQSVVTVNPAMVKAQLEEGADPNGKCGHDSLVMTLLLTAATQRIAERQTILRTLLERGARVEWLDYCADPANGICSTAYLPILQEFAERRAKTREVL